MGKVWSEAAIRDQIEVNRTVRSVKDFLPDVDNLWLPTVVRAAEGIAVNKSGQCAFQKGTLGGILSDTGDTDTMWNVVSDYPIEEDDVCLATRVMIRGEAGWVVFRVSSGTDKPMDSVMRCAVCDTGTAPPRYRAAFVVSTGSASGPAEDYDALEDFLEQSQNLYLDFIGSDEAGYCVWMSKPFTVQTPSGDLYGSSFNFRVQMFWRLKDNASSHFELRIGRSAGVVFGDQTYLAAAIADSSALDCLNRQRSISFTDTPSGETYLASAGTITLIYDTVG
jgi:hypothetical protein